MAKVTLTRSKVVANGIRRDTVKPGQIFQLRKKDGTLGRKLYGALGRNGRLYSLNMESGELAGTGNAAKPVSVVGKFAINTTHCQNRVTSRDKVASGEIFTVKGGDTSYLALGRLKDGRWASVNMKNPLNDDYAATSKGSSEVTVIGSAKFLGEAV